MVMLTVALVALVLSGLLWQRLERIQQELAKRSAEVAEQSGEAHDTAAQAEALTQELQARLSVAEVKLSEVSLQRSQLEELMLSVSRSRDDTLVLDIESGVRLAMQQAELTGSSQPLISALQAADRRIAKSAQPRLNPVQRAMARDIERVQAAVVTDLPSLAVRLDELARMVDDLPLANAPPRPRGGAARVAGTTSTRKPVPVEAVTNAPALGVTPGTAALLSKPATATAVGSSSAVQSDASMQAPDAAARATDGSSSDPNRVESPVTDARSADAKSSGSKSDAGAATPARKAATQAAPKTHAALPTGVETPAVAELTLTERLAAQWHTFWDRTVTQLGQSVRDLVRVSRIDEPEAVLLAPDQGFFLRENLKLKLLNARLGLLSRQVPSARADMQSARAALAKYFDAQAPSTKAAMQGLGDVLQATKTVVLPRPDETLTALAAAAGGR
jgi:uroporphyrin-3 C-methyltransferase